MTAHSDVHREAAAAARDLRDGPRWSIPRIAVDLVMIGALGAAAAWVWHPLLTIPLVLLIGAFPLHDVLVHGHEAIHGLAHRDVRLNAATLWFTHALVGISGAAHRAFHLDHHRHLASEADPERKIHGGGGPIVGTLRVTVLSHALIHRLGLETGRVSLGRVIAELAATAVLHAVILAAFGWKFWLCALVLPASSGLAFVAAARALTEHLWLRPGDLVHTHATAARRIGQVLWSNVDHHVEHHLCPQVPWDRLPELRRRLLPMYARMGVEIDHGLFRTAWDAMHA